MNRQAEGKEILSEQKHELHLLGRRQMKLYGVKDVLNFDDLSVRLLTESGELLIEGKEIRIGTLDTEHGVLALEGKIDAMYYTAEPSKKGNRLFGNLFG